MELILNTVFPEQNQTRTLHRKMSLVPDELKKKVIETYFHPDKMNYQTVRIHMDSCDFSTEMYEADSDPALRQCGGDPA